MMTANSTYKTTNDVIVEYKKQLKQAVRDELKYCATHRKSNYTVEEVIHIVQEVIDTTAYTEN